MKSRFTRSTRQFRQLRSTRHRGRHRTYVAVSEAIRLMEKSKAFPFTAQETASLDAYRGKVDKAGKFIPVGEGGGSAGAGNGHDGGLEAHRGDGRREVSAKNT